MIGYKIEQQNYELVRNAIAVILLTEFGNQLTEFYNTDCDISVIYLQRTDPIDTTELDMVNVSFAGMNFEQWATGYASGVATFFVDFWAKAKSNADDTEEGDKLSALKTQRLMGIGRAILENPIYKTLGFTPGQIGNVRVNQLDSGQMKNGSMDMSNVQVGRLQLQVKISEGIELPEGNLLQEARTQVYLNDTEFGYQYNFIE